MAQESLHCIRLEAWLRSDCNCGYLPPSPPLDIKQPPPQPEQRPQTPIAYTPPSTRLKRKRAMSVPTVLSDTNTDSPIKRQRVENVSDNIDPDQSISQTDSHIQSLVLNERTTFRSPPTTGGASRTYSASPKRVTSPTRETPVMLRTASPPIVTESVHGLKDPPPPEVRTLMRRAESGVHSRFIPQELKALIDADTEIGYEIFQEEDFNNTPYQGSAEVLWGEVRTIFLNARNCADGSRDENAWCMDVVQPIIQLAIRMYGKDKWWLQSVQSQYINPTYLSATRSTGIKEKCIDRKTDYVLSYSHHDPDTAQLYSRLAANNCYEISHVMDTFTKRTALFSGLEIKPSYGSRAEAELQMSIWIAASIRKKMEMASLVGVDLIPASLAEPALTIVGHEHRISYAYPSTDLGEGGVRVLGSSLLLSTVSVRGVFQLLRLYRNLLEYGMDKSDDGYWGGVLGKVLESLASGDGV